MFTRKPVWLTRIKNGLTTYDDANSPTRTRLLSGQLSSSSGIPLENTEGEGRPYKVASAEHSSSAVLFSRIWCNQLPRIGVDGG